MMGGKTVDPGVFNQDVDPSSLVQLGLVRAIAAGQPNPQQFEAGLLANLRLMKQELLGPRPSGLEEMLVDAFSVQWLRSQLAGLAIVPILQQHQDRTMGALNPAALQMVEGLLRVQNRAEALANQNLRLLMQARGGVGAHPLAGAAGAGSPLPAGQQAAPAAAGPVAGAAEVTV